MIGRNWLLALVATGFVAAAPAAAQVSSTNPFDLPQAQRFEHGRPGRHHARHRARQERRHRWHDGTV